MHANKSFTGVCTLMMIFIVAIAGDTLPTHSLCLSVANDRNREYEVTLCHIYLIILLCND